MKERNPDANCANCPYAIMDSIGVAKCHKNPYPDNGYRVSIQKPDAETCGEHPNFFKEQS